MHNRNTTQDKDNVNRDDVTTRKITGNGLRRRGNGQTNRVQLNKGQVTLEDNFRFVQDKSDLKSASDKKFVQKATVALENKICEQNNTPCCERHAISRETAFTRC